MIAFEVYLNGKKLCTAGVGDLGVLSTCLCWRGPHPYKKGGPPVAEYIRLDVGGIVESFREHVRWVDRKIKCGDMVSIKIVELTSVDKPREKQRPDPVEDMRRQKRYVRQMAKRFGWKIRS
jgi:hypothetical protein